MLYGYRRLATDSRANSLGAWEGSDLHCGSEQILVQDRIVVIKHWYQVFEAFLMILVGHERIV